MLLRSWLRCRLLLMGSLGSSCIGRWLMRLLGLGLLIRYRSNLAMFGIRHLLRKLLRLLRFLRLHCDLGLPPKLSDLKCLGQLRLRLGLMRQNLVPVIKLQPKGKLFSFRFSPSCFLLKNCRLILYFQNLMILLLLLFRNLFRCLFLLGIF